MMTIHANLAMMRKSYFIQASYSNLSFEFDVTCINAPRAHTLYPCFDIYVEYDSYYNYGYYISAYFPDVAVYGSDTELLYDRQLLYRFFVL